MLPTSSAVRPSFRLAKQRVESNRSASAGLALGQSLTRLALPLGW